MAKVIFTSFFLLLTLLLGVSAEQCGRQARGALRAGGDTDSYCGDGCRSQRGGGGRVGYVGDIITRERFEEMLKYRDDSRCHAVGFYTYDDFISAAKAFPDFGNTGDNETRERELAAFFGQTSHETTGGWGDAPDGPYAWGYCYKKEVNPQGDSCDPKPNCTCASGKQYYGRGPIQLTWNYNYCPCGEAIGEDLLNNPDLVETDGLISFKAAIWFWMTAQPPKPSCHDVIIGNWTPSQADINANRYPGYGVLINIINGGIECGKGVPNPYVEDRIGFYKRYCDLFGIGYGDNLDCYNQLPFGNGLSELVNSM